MNYNNEGIFIEQMDFYKTELTNNDFARLSNFIYSNYGIKMPLAKKGMLQARLQSRLRANNLGSFKEYCDFVFSGQDRESEIVHMIDVVSTNKTDFFREAVHFDYLQAIVLPEFCVDDAGKELKVWSSACSSGEEMYTIAMVINEFSNNKNRIEYSILGTDISSRILEKASLAIYQEDKVAQLPVNLKMKYLMRNKNPEKADYRIIPELRNKTRFQRLNLMDRNYNVPGDFDIIFCRNVLIYFDRETQEKVINKLCGHLKVGGYFFLGHSESITGIDVPLTQIKPTIYRKISNKQYRNELQAN